MKPFLPFDKPALPAGVQNVYYTGMKTAKLRPELLAPAGDWESLRAAVANGADAVYFGLAKFSARQRAANFTRGELGEVFAYLHGHNVRGYVAFNTLVFSDELAEAAAGAADIAAAGADAVIVQDLGLARLIHRLAPTLPLHASTQMTLTEPQGIEFVRQLGVQRVILARELSLDDIRRLRESTDMPLEVFVHGALCLSYSGQCQASEALWGRSANRGLCGQACRLPYRLLVDGRERDLGDRQYLLSTKDLAAYDRIADLVKLGVAGFKIEGRLKSAHYVAAATQVYRAAIDAAVAGAKFTLSAEQQAGLVQSFSRGFSHGFLDGARHADLVHGLSPKSRGVMVGTVAGTTERGVVIEIEAGQAPPMAGDGVVFDEGHPSEDEQGGRIFSVERVGGGKALLIFGPGAVNLAAVTVQSAVWKTDDPRLERALEKSYARDEIVRRVPMSIRLEANAGRFLRVTAADDAGHKAEAESDAPLEVAIKRPLTMDLVREQFGRLGDTPFELSTIEIFGDTGPTTSAPVMVPKSVLNEVRRQVVQRLLEMRAARAVHVIANPDALATLRAEVVLSETDRVPLAACPPVLPAMTVLCHGLDQLNAVLTWKPADGLPRPAMVYCDFRDLSGYADAVSRGREAGVPIGLATLRITKPGDERFLDPVAEAQPDAVLVRHLAGLRYFRDRLPNLPLIGDFSLNLANELTAALLAGAGLARLTTGLDLNRRQLADLAGRFPPARLEAIIHQHVPLMYSEHCPAAAHLSRVQSDYGCSRPCTTHTLELKDRVGARHTLLFDARCGCTIASGHVQSAIDLVPELRATGLGHFRVELLAEKLSEVHSLLDLYSRALAGRVEPADALAQLADQSPEGVRRGSWDFE
jgi:U32 family peptidase